MTVSSLKKTQLLAPAGLSAKAPKDKIKRPELLAPAGNLEKLKIAIEFGADAVYFGLPDFSLRVRINQFDERAIRDASKYCKSKKKKFYVTLNIFAHQRHLKRLPEHLKLIKEIKPNGVIVSDPGVLRNIREELPDQEIHLSTQANATNSEAIKFWGKQEVKRVILARELTLREIGEIKKQSPDVELECFVHGAMCMSYSGRCILSKWMTGRSANLGDCAQPCRWLYHQIQNSKFKVQGKNKGKRTKKISVIDDQGKYSVDLEEDRHGTYFFNSKDLNMIEHVDEFVECGVESLKIEGRAKSSYYVAVVTRAYRKMIDAAFDLKTGKISKEQYESQKQKQAEELDKLANRGYTEGFYFDREPHHLYGSSSLRSPWQFVGVSKDNENSTKRKIQAHNVLAKSDRVEVVTPEKNISTRITSIHLGKEEIIKAHGGQGKEFLVEFQEKVGGIFLLRKKN